MLLDPFLLPHPAGIWTRIKRYSAKPVHQQSSGCVVFYRKSPTSEPLFLLIHRGSHYQDWTFPKGKIENNRSPRVEALREVKEEVGLTVKILTKLPSSYYNFYVDEKAIKIFNKVHFFLAQSTSQAASLQKNPDHNEAATFLNFRWVNLSEALNLVKPVNMKNILNAAGDYLSGH